MTVLHRFYCIIISILSVKNEYVMLSELPKSKSWPLLFPYDINLFYITPRLVPVSNVIFSSKTDIRFKIIAFFFNFTWSSSRILTIR